MSDASHVARSLRERLGGNTEERLGKALSDLLENPLFTGAVGRAFDAREKAVQAQEVAMGALNLPSAADIERLTRRLRSVSLRLEGIEEGVDRLDGAVSATGADRSEIAQRLSAIESQMERLADRLGQAPKPQGGVKAGEVSTKPQAGGAKPRTGGAKPRTGGAKTKTSGAKPKTSGTGSGRA